MQTRREKEKEKEKKARQNRKCSCARLVARLTDRILRLAAGTVQIGDWLAQMRLCTATHESASEDSAVAQRMRTMDWRQRVRCIRETDDSRV